MYAARRMRGLKAVERKSVKRSAPPPAPPPGARRCGRASRPSHCVYAPRQTDPLRKGCAVRVSRRRRVRVRSPGACGAASGPRYPRPGALDERAARCGQDHDSKRARSRPSAPRMATPPAPAMNLVTTCATRIRSLGTRSTGRSCRALLGADAARLQRRRSGSHMKKNATQAMVVHRYAAVDAIGARRCPSSGSTADPAARSRQRRRRPLSMPCPAYRGRRGTRWRPPQCPRPPARRGGCMRAALPESNAAPNRMGITTSDSAARGIAAAGDARAPPVAWCSRAAPTGACSAPARESWIRDPQHGVGRLPEQLRVFRSHRVDAQRRRARHQVDDHEIESQVHQQHDVADLTTNRIQPHSAAQVEIEATAAGERIRAATAARPR